MLLFIDKIIYRWQSIARICWIRLNLFDEVPLLLILISLAFILILLLIIATNKNYSLFIYFNLRNVYHYYHHYSQNMMLVTGHQSWPKLIISFFYQYTVSNIFQSNLAVLKKKASCNGSISQLQFNICRIFPKLFCTAPQCSNGHSHCYDFLDLFKHSEYLSLNHYSRKSHTKKRYWLTSTRQTCKKCRLFV